MASVDEAIDAAHDGFARLPWSACGPEGERRLNVAGVSVRCLQAEDGAMPDGAGDPNLVAVVGRSY